MLSFFYLPFFTQRSSLSLSLSLSELIAKAPSYHIPLGVVSLCTSRKKRQKKGTTISITAGVCCDSSTLQTQHSMQLFLQNVPKQALPGSKGEVTLKKIHFNKGLSRHVYLTFASLFIDIKFLLVVVAVVVKYLFELLCNIVILI